MWQKRIFDSVTNLPMRFKTLIQRFPKHILVIMIVILLLGIILIFIRRSQIQVSRGDAIGQIINSIPQQDISSELENKRKGGVAELYELIQIKDEVEKVMSKPKLSGEDSLFLKNTNSKLNTMLK